MARPLSSHPLYRAYISPTLKNESRVSREAELVSGNQVQRRAGSEMLESEKREGPTTRFYQHSHSSLLPWEKLSTIPKRDLPMLKFRDTKWKSWLAIFSFNSSPEDKPTLVWTVPNSFKVSHFKLQIDRQRSIHYVLSWFISAFGGTYYPVISWERIWKGTSFWEFACMKMHIYYPRT